MSEFTKQKISVSSLEGFAVHVPKPNHTIQFMNNDGKVIGTLNLNVSPPTFEGVVDGSARVFFDYVVTVFPHLLKELLAEEVLDVLTETEWSDCFYPQGKI